MKTINIKKLVNKGFFAMAMLLVALKQKVFADASVLLAVQSKTGTDQTGKLESGGKDLANILLNGMSIVGVVIAVMGIVQIAMAVANDNTDNIGRGVKILIAGLLLGMGGFLLKLFGFSL